MGQDKEKGREFDLSVDYILILKEMQKDKCQLCLIEMKFEWNRPGDIFQWTVDRIYNNLRHIKGNIRLYASLVLNATEIIKSRSWGWAILMIDAYMRTGGLQVTTLT
jgi:hypothetical protein